MKDYFSKDSESYKQFRPHYPKSLFEYLRSVCKKNDLVWDCGTGNGQAAGALSEYFYKVIATDISAQQISAAIQKENISYHQTGLHCPAENNSVDLITVAQALHWFDLNQFYTEVKRVAAKDAVIAVWSYALLNVDEEIDNIIFDFYENVLEGCWDDARKNVENGYANLPFPFSIIESPEFFIEEQWSLGQLTGYLKTWSAVSKFIETKKHDPVPALHKKLTAVWNGESIKKIIFPLILKTGSVNH